jgi:acyl-CoA thioester hydrolase
MPNLNKTEFRIRYADTDSFGVAYYGSYLRFLEAARTEILRDNGISYKHYEEQGFYAPVARVEVDYKSPARYDDIIIIETKIEKIGNSSIEFGYKITNKETKELIAVAKTVNVFTTKDGEKIPVPEEIRAILKD